MRNIVFFSVEYFSLFVLGLMFFMTSCFSLPCFAQSEEANLNIEVQVLPQAVLQVGSSGKNLFSRGGVYLDFGMMDAFGQNRKSGLLVQKTEEGAIYYHPIDISAGSSGGPAYRAKLQVKLVPGSNQANIEFAEVSGRDEVPHLTPNFLKVGESKTLDSNVTQIKKYERLVGVLIRHNTPSGNMNAQVEYRLDLGL